MAQVIGTDLADVFDENDDLRTVLAWGDPVEVIDEDSERLRVKLTWFEDESDGSLEAVELEGYIKKEPKENARAPENFVLPREKASVLMVDFVDVQQGDAAVLETPDGKVILIDGGDNQLFARYLAGRYRGSSESKPHEIDCIVVTHGDADHFVGLSEIRDSEGHYDEAKRLFVHPIRVFHNGLVKRSSNLPNAEQLGKFEPVGDAKVITDLFDNPRDADGMNEPFERWGKTLTHWEERGEIDLRRLKLGDDDAFSFLEGSGLETEVLGPILFSADGVSGLPFLGAPRRRWGHPSENPTTTYSGISPSHTINGHSVVLRFTYGDWHFFFAGDLNEQSEEALVERNARNEVELRSEVLKVPHHGSAEFLHAFLEAIEPVVSVVSSGDESARKEYIHPRATLMSGLGKYGRPNESVLFVTELVAFFEAKGFVLNRPPDDDKEWSKEREPFYAFSRTAFGIVKVRTDGKRLLVYTNSGQDRMKEAYAFTLEADGTAVPQQLVRV